MDFLVFIILFGAGFFIMHNILDWALGSAYSDRPMSDGLHDCRQSGIMHKWIYDGNGVMKCEKCNKKPLED